MAIQAQLTEIDAQIAALTARKKALEVQRVLAWPKRLRLYAHCTKEENWDKGDALGLTDAALRLFVHFDEVALDVEVAENGTVTILACDGHALQRERRL